MAVRIACLALLMIGCAGATPENTLVRYSHDRYGGCPPDHVYVSKLGGGEYRVSACDHVDDYQCVHDVGPNWTCYAER